MGNVSVFPPRSYYDRIIARLTCHLYAPGKSIVTL